VLAVLALVGRPNVGKSTLFNALTRTRDALVADEPGFTRDRKYGYSRVGVRPAVLIDTGGLVEGPGDIERLTAAQTRKAIEEADRVLLVVDGRAGLTRARLRRARATEAKLTAALQEARAAFEAQDYAKAQTVVAGLEKALDSLLAELEG
jgi:GTP-binding protein